jgi:hypothetical protein
MFQACEGGKPMKSQSVADMTKCRVESSVREDLDGCKFYLLCVILSGANLLGVGLAALPGMSM